MDAQTICYLNALNRHFYETVAADFDASRQRAWEGWERLWAIIEAGVPRPPKVLDIGCGNGRFGVFLTTRLKRALRYHGIDGNAALIALARAALADVEAEFTLRDLVEQPLAHQLDPSAERYDLVVLFGVLHHVPGEAQRQALLRSLAERVAPDGVLAFTEWRFIEEERFRRRIVFWNMDIQVEPGDYLLDWRRGTSALRYCHSVDDAEHERLVAATGLATVAEYRADAANFYTILRNERENP